MSKQRLADALDGLPLAMKSRVMDYVATVQEALPSIFEEADYPQPSQDHVERFIFAVGIRKLWAQIEFQYQTINGALDALGTLNAVAVASVGRNGFLAGSTEFTRNSAAFRALERLRADLDDLLRQGGLREIVAERSLMEVARRTAQS